MVAGSAVFTDGLEMSVLYMKDLASSCFLLNLLATGVTIQSEIYLVFISIAPVYLTADQAYLSNAVCVSRLMQRSFDILFRCHARLACNSAFTPSSAN